MTKFDTTLHTTAKLYLEMAYGTSPNATNITSQQLIEKLSGITDPDKPIKFTSIVTASGRKKDPETQIRIQELYKVSQVSATFNVDYKAKRTVAGREAGELAPDQEHQLGRSYGTHDTSTIIDYQGRKYIQVVPTQALPPQFVLKDNVGALRKVTRAEALPYLRVSPLQVGPAASIPIRRYQLTSIVAVEIDGQDFKITDVEPNRQAVLDIVEFNDDAVVGDGQVED